MRTLRFPLVAALCALSFPSVFAQDEKPTREPAKPQASVASKTAKFGTVKPGDGSVTKALKATDLDAARKLAGKPGTFEGKVAALFTPRGNGLVILNFDKNFRNALTAVVRSKSYADFPNLESLKGKRVLITGTFEDYKGSPQVLLSKPEQLKLIED